jgi:hypothetical protein
MQKRAWLIDVDDEDHSIDRLSLWAWVLRLVAPELSDY